MESAQMSEPTLWWLLCAAAVAAELMTGTFYLLMIAVGLGAAALGAHAGLSITLQIVIAAAIGAGAVAAWHQIRGRQPRSERASANKDVSLDIGQTVQVQVWDAQGLARVSYRGADWSASLAPGAASAPGTYRIVEIIGSRLIVKPV
jgi:membrane protein implicated in regulation of membrane protease activity